LNIVDSSGSSGNTRDRDQEDSDTVAWSPRTVEEPEIEDTTETQADVVVPTGVQVEKAPTIIDEH